MAVLFPLISRVSQLVSLGPLHFRSDSAPVPELVRKLGWPCGLPGRDQKYTTASCTVWRGLDCLLASTGSLLGPGSLVVPALLCARTLPPGPPPLVSWMELLPWSHSFSSEEMPGVLCPLPGQKHVQVLSSKDNPHSDLLSACSPCMNHTEVSFQPTC